MKTYTQTEKDAYASTITPMSYILAWETLQEKPDIRERMLERNLEQVRHLWSKSFNLLHRIHIKTTHLAHIALEADAAWLIMHEMTRPVDPADYEWVNGVIKDTIEDLEQRKQTLEGLLSEWGQHS